MVKCLNCGFLILINEQDSRFENCHIKIRQSEKIDLDPAFWALFDPSLFPDCAERALNMKKESGNSLLTVLDIIKQERCCQEYIRWRPGDSIKEHREYKERERFQDWQTRMEERRTQFEVERRNEDLQWRKEQEQKAENHHQDQLQQARQMHKNELIVLGVFVTAAIVLVTVLGSAIEARWISEWFGLAN